MGDGFEDGVLFFRQKASAFFGGSVIIIREWILHRNMGRIEVGREGRIKIGTRLVKTISKCHLCLCSGIIELGPPHPMIDSNVP